MVVGFRWADVLGFSSKGLMCIYDNHRQIYLSTHISKSEIWLQRRCAVHTIRKLLNHTYIFKFCNIYCLISMYILFLLPATVFKYPFNNIITQFQVLNTPPVDLHWFFEISIGTEKKFQLELKKNQL